MADGFCIGRETPAAARLNRPPSSLPSPQKGGQLLEHIPSLAAMVIHYSESCTAAKLIIAGYSLLALHCTISQVNGRSKIR